MGYNESNRKETPMHEIKPKREDFGNGIFIIWKI